MPKQSTAAAELRDRTGKAAADFGDAADAVDSAASIVLGINRTDFRILSALQLHGPMSAGALGEFVALSPAATTEAVQRLAARGRVSREVDPTDRRRAVIALDPATRDELNAMYGGVRDAGHALLDRYTDAELTVIADFLDRGREMQLRQAERITREFDNGV